MIPSTPRGEATADVQGPEVLSGGRTLRLLQLGVLVASIVLCTSPKAAETPDIRTWRFSSEKKLHARLYYTIPGSPDSIAVSDDAACCPSVSPGGQWAACTSFNAKAIESELLLLSSRSEKWRPIPGYTVISYQWSPNGRNLAGYAKRRTAGSVCFFVVRPEDRAAWFADSILVAEDYEFAWDSTSTRVAICRPGNGRRSPPSVLVLNVISKRVTTLAALQDGEPASPRWLADSSLVVTKKSVTSGDSLLDLRFPMPRR